jgi:hypothetical protein
MSEFPMNEDSHLEESYEDRYTYDHDQSYEESFQQDDADQYEAMWSQEGEDIH